MRIWDSREGAQIAGQSVEVVALPLIFDKLREARRSPSDDVAQDLLAMVKVYNYVAPEAEALGVRLFVREYAAQCEHRGVEKSRTATYHTTVSGPATTGAT